MKSPGERSIAELFSDAFAQLAKLIGNEFDLAKAELSEKAGQMGRGVAMIGAGAIFMIPALVVLLLSAASAMTHAGLSEPVAYFLAGGAALAAAGALIALGVNRMSADTLKPVITIEQLQRDKAAAKEMVR
jgi:Putative Actinobacterial Holin-X, holin superfamily III